MRKTHIALFLLGMLLLHSYAAGQSRAADFPWPSFMTAIFAGQKLPPGTIVFPKTGNILARYDRNNSTDWIEIVGTSKAGRPELPITRMRGSIDGYPFTFYCSNNTFTRLDYDIWQLLFSHNTDGTISGFTLSRKATAAQQFSVDLAATNVDCTISKDKYKNSRDDAEALIWLAVRLLYSEYHPLALDTANFQDKTDGLMGEIIYFLRQKKGFLRRLVQYEANDEAFKNWDRDCSKLMYFVFKRSGTGYRVGWSGMTSKMTGSDDFYQQILPKNLESEKTLLSDFGGATASACRYIHATPWPGPRPSFPDIWEPGAKLEVVGHYSTKEDAYAAHGCQYKGIPDQILCNMWDTEILNYPGFWEHINRLCGE